MYRPFVAELRHCLLDSTLSTHGPASMVDKLINGYSGIDLALVLGSKVRTSVRNCAKVKVKAKLKLNKALDENSSLSYGTSPAIWDHTVLHATRHK